MNISNFYDSKYSFSYKNKIHVLSDEVIKARENEVYFFHKELKVYGFNIKDLSSDKPDFKTRNILINIAFFIKDNYDLFKFVEEQRNLPIRKLSFEVKESPLFVDRWQGYIISYLLIISNKRYHHLRNYLNVEENTFDEDSNYELKKDNIAGLNMFNTTNNSCVILTSYGVFLTIVPHTTYNVGEIVIGKLAKNFKFLMKAFFILILIGIISYSTYYYAFKAAKNIIVLDINTNINVTVNKFNKVVDVSASSIKGKKLIKNTDNINLNSNVDEVLSSLLKTALQTKVIFDYDKVSIFVNKNPLDFDSLTETNNIVLDSHIDLRVNNNGQDYYLK